MLLSVSFLSLCVSVSKVMKIFSKINFVDSLSVFEIFAFLWFQTRIYQAKERERESKTSSMRWNFQQFIDNFNRFSYDNNNNNKQRWMVMTTSSYFLGKDISTDFSRNWYPLFLYMSKSAIEWNMQKEKVFQSWMK